MTLLSYSEPELCGAEKKQESHEPLIVSFSDHQSAQILFGENNNHLKLIKKATGIDIFNRGSTLRLIGETENVKLAEIILQQLYGLIIEKYPIYTNDVKYAIRILSDDHKANLKAIFLDTVYITRTNKHISPRSSKQKDYIDAIRNSDIVFAIGPAGTGKTYLSMAMAVSALSQQLVKRIILTRPAVEAGETLGFLPGDLAEKVNPYLRPLYDALYDMMRYEKVSDLMQKSVIEVAPLAFMRGRTLNDAFIILDEAQNTTSEQMKMFLTRIGFNSKAVITGDITQIDLPDKKNSGLVEANQILESIKGIDFIYFSKDDVVRHRLVQDIIEAYDSLCKK